MQYFRYYPTIDYTFTPTTGVPFTLTTVNTTVHMKVVERLRQNVTVYYDYIIRDGERPDTIAASIYGSVNYTWVVLLLNGIFSLFDWPLTQAEFERFLIDKYGSVAASQAQLLYQTSTGVPVDALTYSLLAVSDRGVVRTQYDEELLHNDAKRRIKLIPTAFLNGLMTDLKHVLNP